jgi:hypothetical protein
VTLDLARIAHQIDAMIAGVDRAREGERFDALRSAWNTFDEIEVNRRFATARTSFLLARASAGYQRVYDLPPLPANHTVVASDGSMILPDRHSPARFYLLNVGKVLLRYGDAPRAQFAAEPDLRFAEADLVIEVNGRRQAANDIILGLRRAAAELRAARDLIAEAEPPAVALLDGTLILWALQSQDKALIDLVLEEFLEALWTFKQQRFPVASYISAPGATDLMNTLRVSVCDYPQHGWDVNCDHCRRRILNERHTPACDILPSVTDRYLLRDIVDLRPGQRTSVFRSDSSILEKYGDDHRICFFYLHAGHEVARIEIPQWVGQDDELLNLIHAAVYEQCQLGRGYPVALQEAHEMAVLSMADRRLVEDIIERRLAALGVVLTRTGKDGSKRGRFV